MYKKILSIYVKYKEPIKYLIFGGLTTVVNFVSYLLFTRIFGTSELISTGIAWFLSVIFAYVTNKIFVFESKSTDIKTLALEVLSFFSCRIFSGVLDVGIMYVFVTKLHLNDIAIKILSNIIVVVINYVFSKLWIFKSRPSQD